MRYTREMLAALATAAGYEITERTVKDWDDRGFLPEPSNERVGEPARGRAPLSYPERTPDAVMWLAQYRRYVEGEGSDEVVKFWLWIEGLYPREFDVRAFLLARIRRMWATIQAELPMLGDLDSDEALSEFDRQEALDTLDATVTAPKVASGEWGNEDTAQATVFAALLGLIPNEALADSLSLNHSFDDETPFIDSFFNSSADEHTRERGRTVLPSLIRAGQLRTAYRTIVDGRIDFPLFARAWRMFTPEALSALFSLSPSTVVNGTPVQSRHDLMRAVRYEPLAVVMLGVMIASAAPQPPPDTSTREPRKDGAPIA